MPFRKLSDNILNLYNEIVVAVIFFEIILINTLKMSQEIKTILGWISIGLVLLSLIVTWILILPGLINDSINSIKELYYDVFGGKPEPEKIQTKEENLKSSIPEKPKKVKKVKKIRKVTIKKTIIISSLIDHQPTNYDETKL